MYQIGWDFEKLIFGDTPLGRELTVDPKELIKSVTQEQFFDYQNKLYTPNLFSNLQSVGILTKKNLFKKYRIFQFKTLKNN